MTSMVTRLTDRMKKRFLGLRIRKAKDITDSERETCERYGEQVIGAMLASGMYPGTGELRTIHGSEEAKIHARDWLTERADIQARRDRWIPLRDLLLEIAVISLICWEIRLGYKQESQQAESFSKQQQILQNLNDSSKATADTLVSLKETTDLELAAMKESTGLSERSAKASEKNALTAAKALHMSERPYLSATIVLSAPPKAGEKLTFDFRILNSGRTTALEVQTMAKAIFVPKGTPEDDAFKQTESAVILNPIASKSILAAGQPMEQRIEGPTLTDQQVLALAEGKIMTYAFIDIKYKDLFDHQHRTEMCTFYVPSEKRMFNCASINRAD